MGRGWEEWGKVEGERNGGTDMIAKMRYVLYPIEAKATGVIITTKGGGGDWFFR